ncbi:DUF4136 domain-containing protein [Croceicoccus sp. F390]|uniref:DUF4136 domain-containing protein n=1 Tax=Croceicoccus esteveae TaxID=3075597 RepID=A0ABU2ZHK8_9SPHN|nr:DUF4136 domain-containing protein [Croceicoccus sp. F390]MDT0575779.1 DUF4136 domain-containing protein [Croceicoccus sp. F390]
MKNAVAGLRQADLQHAGGKPQYADHGTGIRHKNTPTTGSRWPMRHGRMGMMNRFKISLPARPLLMLAPLVLGACATGAAPVEVTRFNAPAQLAQLGRGTIAVTAAPGMAADSLALEPWRAAVAAELAQAGYTPGGTGAAGQVAEIRVQRDAFRPGRERGPVSVGVGGSTGGYRSGVGIGVGLDLSGPPAEQVATELSVVIRDTATGQSIWEGRAEQMVKAGSQFSDTRAAAERLAKALFVDFPGTSGETYTVK